MDDAVDEVVQRLLAQASTLWPESPPHKITLEKKATRPYSNVYRMALAGGKGEGLGAIYIKIFKSSARNLDHQEKYRARLQTEFEISRQLRALLPGGHEFGVVHALACYSDLLALVTAEAKGQVLAHLIEAACKHWHPRSKLANVVIDCQRAGAALAAMQAATAAPAPLDLDELWEYIELRLQRLVEGREVPFSIADQRLILNFLERTLARIPAEQLAQCGCHCDYAPFNLLAAHDHLTLIDFSMFKTGSRYNDVTYFHHRLESYLHKPVFSTAAIRAAQQAFFQAYNQAAFRGARQIEDDLLFRVFWIKHVVNNYSAIMRGRIVAGKKRPLPVRLFNRHIYRRYNAWLVKTCSQNF